MSPYVAAWDGEEAGQRQSNFVMERSSGEHVDRLVSRPRAILLAPVFRDLCLPRIAAGFSRGELRPATTLILWDDQGCSKDSIPELCLLLKVFP
ncbi:hypothetical protein [Mesorhizobium sp. M0522]|uniref:hypothetical protein n=1 Tax=Mesorhizobium sp. M0522 TaxID=2956958 RepID=UPI00333BCFFA